MVESFFLKDNSEEFEQRLRVASAPAAPAPSEVESTQVQDQDQSVDLRHSGLSKPQPRVPVGENPPRRSKRGCCGKSGGCVLQ